MEFHVLAVSQDRDKKTSRSGNSYWNIDKVSSHDFIPVNDRVNNRVFLEGKSGSLKEEGHEAKLDVIFFQEIFS